ncbi:hypothetical protein LCGC14_1862170, partial [marine sediment metagenome]
MRELAMIKDVKFGTRDVGKAILSFTAVGLNGSSLQILSAKEAINLIEEHQIVDIGNLNGMACILETKKTETLPM